ncbi:MAG: IS66 family insertion sequence element accessory protein TnpA [Dethiobacteria bacterium]|jgi:hypothetical protein
MTRAEKRKEWETRITRYRASGQSVREWCAANNVKPECRLSSKIDPFFALNFDPPGTV